jgi:hypothetical protein
MAVPIGGHLRPRGAVIGVHGAAPVHRTEPGGHGGAQRCDTPAPRPGRRRERSARWESCGRGNPGNPHPRRLRAGLRVPRYCGGGMVNAVIQRAGREAGKERKEGVRRRREVRLRQGWIGTE